MKTITYAPLLALSAALAAPMAAHAQAAAAPASAAAAAQPASAVAAPVVSLSQRCTSIVPDDEPSQVVLGKSAVIPLKQRVTRVIVSGQAAARQGAAGAGAGGAQGSPGMGDVEVMLLSPTDLFFRGRQTGTMNVVLQNAAGTCFIKDVIVTVDASALQAKLHELMPEERGVRVLSADKSIVLAGQISSAPRVDDLMNLAMAYGGDSKRIVNLLRVGSSQQVMLEVKIAEVSKNLMDRLGASVGAFRASGSGTYNYSLISDFLSGGAGLVEALKIGRYQIQIDGQKDDGLVRVLAEPNIMAISGQQASFLSGGKIFIPVSQSSGNTPSGIGTISLEEKEFGIGVKFTPTVLGDGRINLKLVSEVSDLSQTGSPFTTVNGVTAVLPSMTVRRADTTVQLNDGQSFVIAGLIKNNSNEAVKRFPGLGEVPVMGALFRSTEFQTEQSELMFVITPRLVRPIAGPVRVPTDNHVLPTRAEVYLNGSMESLTPAPAPAPAPVQDATPATNVNTPAARPAQ